MYFYQDNNGQQRGPIAANDLPGCGVTPQTLVWKDGMSDWQPAGSVDELSVLFAPPPPIFATSPSTYAPPPPTYAPQQPTYAPQQPTYAPQQPMYAQQQPMYAQQQPMYAQEKPNNFLAWSIFATLVCCLPTGIVAIVMSSKVNSCWDRGDYEGAHKASKNAKIWLLVSVGIGIIIYIYYFAPILAFVENINSLFDLFK